MYASVIKTVPIPTGWAGGTENGDAKWMVYHFADPNHPHSGCFTPAIMMNKPTEVAIKYYQKSRVNDFAQAQMAVEAIRSSIAKVKQKCLS